MSTNEIKDATTGMFQRLMQSPFAVLSAIGVMLWYASLMRDEQLHALRELMTVLNNPFGIGILALIVMSLLYAMVYPIFGFLARTITSYMTGQTATQTLMREHFEASKHLYEEMLEIKRSICIDIPKRLDALEEQYRQHDLRRKQPAQPAK